MSRIGKKPIPVPKGVEVKLAGKVVSVKGPLKFFRPATAGIFGCVAALSRLRRVEPAC